MTTIVFEKKAVVKTDCSTIPLLCNGVYTKKMNKLHPPQIINRIIYSCEIKQVRFSLLPLKTIFGTTSIRLFFLVLDEEMIS